MVCEWSELTTGRWNLTIAARGLDFRQRRPPHQFKCLPDTDDILRDFIETNERRFCLRSLDLRDFDIANVLFRLETVSFQLYKYLKRTSVILLLLLAPV